MRVVAAAALAAVLLVCGACGDDDDSASPTSTTMATGGISIETPDGWLSVPLPMFGFGIAVPPGWEATRLDSEALASLGQADPAVPDFASAAHNAYTNGSVFYAAGADPQGRIADVKVGAALDTGVKDPAGLEAYAQNVATGLVDPAVTVVPETDHPTVDIRFRGQGTGSAGELTVEGTQRLILSPRGAVYSLILTTESPETHDQLAAEILKTFTFGEGA